MVGLDFRVKLGLELWLYDPATGECLRNHWEREARVQKQSAARQSAEAEFQRLHAQLRDLQSQR